jgi:hypothetical protein
MLHEFSPAAQSVESHASTGSPVDPVGESFLQARSRRSLRRRCRHEVTMRLCSRYSRQSQGGAASRDENRLWDITSVSPFYSARASASEARVQELNAARSAGSTMLTVAAVWSHEYEHARRGLRRSDRWRENYLDCSSPTKVLTRCSS